MVNVKKLLVLDIHNRHNEFEGFLQDLQVYGKLSNTGSKLVRYKRKERRDLIFTGDLSFLSNNKKIRKLIKKEIPDGAEVIYQTDEYDEHSEKHIKIECRKNRFDAFKRFYDDLDLYETMGFYQTIRRFLENKFGENNVFSTMAGDGGIGVSINELRTSKLKKLRKEFKNRKEDLRGLSCVYPDEITISIPYNTSLKGRKRFLANYYFHIELFGEKDDVNKIKTKIIDKYKELKFNAHWH